ncbi:MAG TPA: CocE/NonD family hydrolase [Verrucomicrobiae bacterium]|nr:CocE/NonD family hydrolase [Verrucomicrobiae bacterium]
MNDAGKDAVAGTVTLERNIEARMRDGTVLRADLYRPAAGGRHPVLLQRTPYNKEMLALTGMTLDPLRAAAAGYNVVIQDVRARWASDGGPFFLYRDEGRDGADSVEWAAMAPWSDGRIGAYGVSYMGGTAWQAAVSAPPALRAISPTTAPNDFWRDHLWRGGALNWGLLVTWSLQAIGPGALLRAKAGKADLQPSFLRLVDDIDAFEERVRDLPLRAFAPARLDEADFLPFFHETLGHPAPDPWTDSLLVSGKHRAVQAPALIIAGWHDVMLDGDLEHFASMKSRAATEEARRATRIVIGPWSHGMFQPTVGDLDFGMRASGSLLDLREDLTSLQLRWFDRWLKEQRNGVDDEAPVRIFVQGINRWRDESAWPLARARPTKLYLRSDRGLAWESPDPTERADTYSYDPADPCPTCGGSLLMPGVYRRGPVDQAPLMSRADVLTYTSAVLERDLEVTGPVSFTLFAASSAPDTDWVVKLCDVHPNGRTFNVTDGVLRASYRESLSRRSRITPDTVVRYDIRLQPTSMVFRAGHRLRVLVTSSDFPRYDRNPNTGELGVDATTLVTARQRIFHDGDRPSHLVLPVIPGA